MPNYNARQFHSNDDKVGDPAEWWLASDGTNGYINVPTGGNMQTLINGVTAATTSSTGLSLPTASTATGAALAVTLSTQTGTVTTESLATAAGSDVVYVVTNTLVKSTSIVLAVISAAGTNTTLPVYVRSVVPASGSFTVNLRNAHASAALNGTLVFSFVVFP